MTVAGAEKRDAVERIRAGEDLPGARIRGERVLWLGDRAAMGGAVRSRLMTEPRGELLELPLAELMAAAAARATRGSAPGSRTRRRCSSRSRCCAATAAATARSPRRRRAVAAPYLTPDDVLAIARRGAELGCWEALFTLGEAPEARYPQAAEWLAANGYASTVDYLVAAASWCSTRPACSPTPTPARSQAELERLRAVSPSQGMMIETLAARLGEPGGPHYGAPDKTPERRLATLEAAGRARVPFTTGILVGIGETRAERIDALEAIADAHRRHGHVQEVIVQNFLPKLGHVDAPGRAVPARRAAVVDRGGALVILPADVHLQAPPNLSDDLAPLLAAGIDDWGGVSPVTVDHVNPERPWPALERLQAATEAAGHTLAPRLTIYPEFVRDPDTWLDPALRTPVLVASDSEGLARDGAWSPGRDDLSPAAACRRPAGARQERGRRSARRRRCAGEEVGVDEIVTLLSARGPEVAQVAAVADELRREIVGDEVTFVRNRNINYTNVCTFKCRFCAFSKGPLSLNLRGQPYLLEMEEMQRAGGRGGRVRRDRGVPAGRDPSPTSTATTTSTSRAP